MAGKSQLRVKLSPTGTCSRPDSRSHQRPAPARESAVPRPRSCGGVGGHRQDGRGHRAGSGVDSATSGLGRTRPPPYLSPESGRRPGRAWGCLARTALHTHTCAHVVLHTHVCTHAPAHTCTTLFKGPCGPLPGPWEPLSLGVWSASGTSVTISNQGPCHREAGVAQGLASTPFRQHPSTSEASAVTRHGL